MATFKVGQRVRVIHQTPSSIRSYGNVMNMQGTITMIPCPVYGDGVSVALDGRGEWHFWPDYLAPLTDPKADAFLERIKKLKPYDEPVVRKTVIGPVTVTHPLDSER